ncbi:unnamed protein product [Pleuronectes platessa]|uniref:Uncharacterized protein n=1 Tax=Pleuronectes platessa TaxID=8262 RepID=A0A9N7V6T6_PLEPL|nr:unnamed protein product [Pleuronectes platessa]
MSLIVIGRSPYECAPVEEQQSLRPLQHGGFTYLQEAGASTLSSMREDGGRRRRPGWATGLADCLPATFGNLPPWDIKLCYLRIQRTTWQEMRDRCVFVFTETFWLPPFFYVDCLSR